MTAPEQLARQNIDRMLEAAGWVIQDMKSLNPGASPGIAIREYPTDTGPADYALLLDRTPIGIIEAKKEGVALSSVQDQAGRYATSALKYTIKNGVLPFVFESTGVETRFTDNRDPKPRARGIFSFPRPETLRDRLESPDTFRKRLKAVPALDPAGLRACQINAITRLEESLAHNRPKALVQMATGSGKTFTAITSVYRLLKHAKAKRILFLVDTKNLANRRNKSSRCSNPTTTTASSRNCIRSSAWPRIPSATATRSASALSSACIPSSRARPWTKARSRNRCSKPGPIRKAQGRGL